MIQPFAFSDAVFIVTNNHIGNLFLGIRDLPSTDQFTNPSINLVDGTIRGLTFRTNLAPTAAGTINYVVQIGGVDTAMQVTIANSDLTGRYTGDLAIADGDVIGVRGYTTGAPVAGNHLWTEFEVVSTNPKQSQYHHFFNGDGYVGLFSNAERRNTPDLAGDIIPTDGVIDKMAFRGTTNAGAQGHTFAIMLNTGSGWVLQDGSPGTVDTRMHLSTPGTCAALSTTFSLPVQAGWRACIIIYQDTPGVGAASGTVSVRFLADRDGESIAAIANTYPLIRGGTEYWLPRNPDDLNMNGTDTADVANLFGSLTPFDVGKFWVYLKDAGPGLGETRTFTLRHNRASTSVTFSLTGATQVGNDLVHGFTMADGDVFCIEDVATAHTTDSIAAMSLVQFIEPPPTTGTLIITKVTDPAASPQAFTIHAPGLTPDTFSLSDGGSQTFLTVPPGTYSVTEDLPAGWTQTGISVSSGAPASAIVLAAGDTITVTISNQQTGSLTVQKVTDPAGATQPFTLQTSADPNPFVLRGGEARTFTTLPPGTYSVVETVPPEWTQTSVTVSTGDPVSAIVLGPGDAVSVTFLNTQQVPSGAAGCAAPNPVPITPPASCPAPGPDPV